MPWLVGTALIHSLAVTEKRGAFKSWTVLLAITAFSPEPARHVPRALGRADVGARVRDRSAARRVHSRAAHARDRRARSCSSRCARRASATGGAFRAGVARIVAALEQRDPAGGRRRSVLLGTLYPLAIDALGLGKLSVGPPYFNAVFVPLMVPLLVLVAVGPIARWKEASGARARPAARGARRASPSRPASPCRSLSAAGIRCAALGDGARGLGRRATAANVRQRLARTGARGSRAPGTACTSRISGSRCA